MTTIIIVIVTSLVFIGIMIITYYKLFVESKKVTKRKSYDEIMDEEHNPVKAVRVVKDGINVTVDRAKTLDK